VAASSTEPTAELRTIGSVAREVGLTARAIRYYEEIGLLQPAVRVKGADRLFDESDVQRLREIKRLHEVIGFTLSDIKEILDTEDVRKQLRSEFRGTTDRRVRRELLQKAIRLSEDRLRIVERKLAQVESVRSEESRRLTGLRERLDEEERMEDAEYTGEE
jgi:DNA-binding transcriptional MerR regulator